jgi:hypothetical protein
MSRECFVIYLKYVGWRKCGQSSRTHNSVFVGLFHWQLKVCVNRAMAFPVRWRAAEIKFNDMMDRGGIPGFDNPQEIIPLERVI